MREYEMSTLVSVLGILGSITAFLTAAALLMRAIIRNVNATHENTEAVMRMADKMNKFGNTLNQHTVDIAVLRDRFERRNR